MNILKEKGIFAFICSNKFAKAKYGEKLRKLILKNQLKIYNDFTGVKIFKEASVDTCVIQIKKNFIENNEVFVNNEYYMEQNRLNTNSFAFNNPEILDLRDKILNQGTLIKDLDIDINYGIKTGFNEAFIIDEETKNKLILEDSKNKEIIKPLLRGRDINKWKILSKNLFLIYVPWSFNIKKYPSIYGHLSKFKDKLSARPEVKNGRYNWYCMSRYAADYVDLFEKEKIIYPEISSQINLTYDNNGFYMDKTCFIITTELNIKYLCALLSSNVLNFVFKLLGTPLGASGFNLSKIYIEQLPIKFTDSKIENEITEQVNELLKLNEIVSIKTESFHELLISTFYVNKISNKLYNFYDLTIDEFLKECKKQKIDISNEKRTDDLISKFMISSNEIKNLNLKIRDIETKMNDMIYKIYELSENEIKIIES